jgi:D-alanyl-D-alanine carboxypeptidase (penicillin-binding protein 5/6)
MKGDIIQSGNDASVALAEHVSGTESVFVEVMNQHAARLGMRGSRFRNSTGLPDPEHYTTARDLALLSADLIRRYPDIYQWFSIREFTWNGIAQPNRNRLLGRDESVDGIKTGFTAGAGYCLAASAARDGRRLIAIVLGAESESARAGAASALLNYGFRFTETRMLYAAGAQVSEMQVWKSSIDKIRLGVAGELAVTIPRDHYPALDARVDVNAPLVAPLAAGAEVGTLTVSLNGKELARRPIIALHEAPEAGFFGRMIDAVKLKFQ